MICTRCQSVFEPAKAHQKFCSRKCRNDWNNAHDGGTYMAVSRVTMLKGGKLSVVLTCSPLEREAALSALEGGIVQILGQWGT